MTDRGPAACTIRPPAPPDYPGLAELCGQLGYPSTAADIARRLGGMHDPQEFVVWVAERADDRLSGFVSACIVRTLETDPVVEISGLVVNERDRSQGIGRLLVEAVEAWARERTDGSVAVRSNVIRTRAHAFYTREGFAKVKTQASFLKRP